MAIGPYVVGGIGAGSSVSLFVLRGLHVGTVVVPDTAGLDYRSASRRAHYRGEARRAHYSGEARRLHYRREK